MKMPLKYFLALCLILGAVVAPFAHKKYQEWKQQRSSTKVFYLKNIRVNDAKAILEQVYDVAVKPNAETGRPELVLRSDQRLQSLSVTARPALVAEVRKLIEAMDIPSPPAQPPIQIKFSPQPLQRSLQRLLPEKDRPSPNDLSHA